MAAVITTANSAGMEKTKSFDREAAKLTAEYAPAWGFLTGSAKADPVYGSDVNEAYRAGIVKLARIMPTQLRAARGLLDWSRTQCGQEAGVSSETIKNIEQGESIPSSGTMEKIVTGFSKNGVHFLDLGDAFGVIRKS